MILSSRDTPWKEHSRKQGIQQIEIVTLPRADKLLYQELETFSNKSAFIQLYLLYQFVQLRRRAHD